MRNDVEITCYRAATRCADLPTHYKRQSCVPFTHTLLTCYRAATRYSHLLTHTTRHRFAKTRQYSILLAIVEGTTPLGGGGAEVSNVSPDRNLALALGSVVALVILPMAATRCPLPQSSASC